MYPLESAVPENILVLLIVHPPTVPDVADPVALMVAVESLSTFPKSTSSAVVLAFKVLFEVKSVPPICRVPENVPLAPVISPLKNALPDVSI